MKIEISFNDISVQDQSNNSTVSVGYVLQNGWAITKKENSAMGSVSNNSEVINPQNIIKDNDCFDALVLGGEDDALRMTQSSDPKIRIRYKGSAKRVIK